MRQILAIVATALVSCWGEGFIYAQKPKPLELNSQVKQVNINYRVETLAIPISDLSSEKWAFQRLMSLDYHRDYSESISSDRIQDKDKLFQQSNLASKTRNYAQAEVNQKQNF